MTHLNTTPERKGTHARRASGFAFRGLLGTLLALAACQSLPTGASVPRVSAEELHARLAAHEPVFVVFAPKTGSPRTPPLPGSISFEEFQARAASLLKDVEIILYCGCPEDLGSRYHAAGLLSKGFTRVSVLEGGIYAWIRAGYGTNAAPTQALSKGGP